MVPVVLENHKVKEISRGTRSPATVRWRKTRFATCPIHAAPTQARQSNGLTCDYQGMRNGKKLCAGTWSSQVQNGVFELSKMEGNTCSLEPAPTPCLEPSPLN
ncbi:hypothetical protein RUM44_010972 [Polyplax serrata]|uniref:Uncharacterized protein n=1 Tax=Polyplax serrata TaxID=468196 RepID=A0ABR1ANR5_POLSC